jgi:hypothetical protein
MSDQYIKREDCKDRVLYRIASRNLRFGVFNKAENGFNGIREKFGRLYIFQEYHYDNGPPFGTVLPLIELTEVLPPEIENVSNLAGSWCSVCNEPVEYVKEPHEKTYSDGETIRFPGRWKHVNPNSSEHDTDYHAYSKSNDALFKWLELMEKKYGET